MIKLILATDENLYSLIKCTANCDDPALIILKDPEEIYPKELPFIMPQPITSIYHSRKSDDQPWKKKWK